MPIIDRFNEIMDAVIVGLKTIPQLATSGTDVRVYKHKGHWKPIKGRFEAVVMAGQMEALEGATTKSTYNEFNVIVDLVHYGSDNEASFSATLGVAGAIYDKFHLTSIDNNVRIAFVSLYPGDGSMQRTLLAVPIRIIIRCERTITQ